jgi:pseudomonalisin
MIRKGKAPLLVGGALMLTAGAASASGSIGAAHALAAGTHVLSGQSLASEISISTAVGPVAPTTVLTIGVALTPADVAGEQATAMAVYDPSSPQYHQYFTPASWAARFAVPQATYDATVQMFTSQGFQVVYSAATRDYFDLQGTAAEVDQAFQITLTQYRAPTGTVWFGNDRPPMVPDTVDAVAGLSDLGTHTHQTNCVGGVCTGVVEYSELWSVYNLPAAYTGSGQKIAIIGNGDTGGPTQDLHKYESDRGLPIVPTVCHPVSGNACLSTTNTGNEGEWALDSESSTSMAPSVGELDYYFSSSLGDPAAFSAWVNDPNGPTQANASFGGCEIINAIVGNITAEDPIFAQAAAEGRTQFVSTGDTGGSCTVITGNGIVNTIAPQVEWPASSRWVIGVGGTVLYTDGNGHRANLPSGPAEIAWTHTGGGTSFVEPEQSWQQPIQVIVGKCTENADGTPNANPGSCRGLPDVAAMSGDITVVGGGNGFKDVEGGTDSGPGLDGANGGTSLSSPLWAGMWTRMQSAVGPLGFAAPRLYAIGLDPVKDVADFYDVTQGSNGQFTAIARNNNPPQPDPSGWDYVSGLGAPDVSKLIADFTTPVATTPESPSTPLLLVMPLALLGAFWARRRRRSRGADTPEQA